MFVIASIGMRRFWVTKVGKCTFDAGILAVSANSAYSENVTPFLSVSLPFYPISPSLSYAHIAPYSVPKLPC